MYLRRYEKTDFQYIKTWAENPEIHTFWCANRMSFPVTEQEFNNMLDIHEKVYNGHGYCYVTDEGIPKAFCVYLVNEVNEGFIKFVIVDHQIRGCGYGSSFLEELLKYAFDITKVDEVKLNVLDMNLTAVRCYKKIGFTEEEYTADVLQYDGISYGRYSMKKESPKGK